MSGGPTVSYLWQISILGYLCVFHVFSSGSDSEAPKIIVLNVAYK